MDCRALAAAAAAAAVAIADVAVALAPVLAVASCRARPPELPWREEDLGAPASTPRGTLADAQARLAAAHAPGDLVRAAVDVAALGGDLTARAGDVRAAIDQASEAELADALAAAEPARAPSGAIALRLALLAHHRGDDATARARLDAYAREPEPDLADRAAALSVETTAADARVIAVLLPLSGAHQAIGVALRGAIELANRAGATVVYEDTAGDEAGAAAAVDRAAARGAVAILGPVGERESVAAARRAAELGVPIALLAPADGADAAAGVFRLATSPSDEARGAARVAAAQSFPTVAVLAPRDDVGEAMADAFAAEAAADGLTVARVGFYDPTASDLEPDVKAFLGLDPAHNPRLAAHLRRHGKKGWQDFTPDIDFSLLYLPDRYDRATLVAAYLPYLGVELHQGDASDDPDLIAKKHGGRIPQVVQLLGSGGWNAPGLLTRGGDTVEGAMFVDACAGGLDEGGTSSEVAARYHDATGDDAGAPVLEAYDAATIVLAARAAIPADAADPREAIRKAIARAHLDDGACPPAAVGPDGELAREPVLVQVDGGEMVLQSQ